VREPAVGIWTGPAFAPNPPKTKRQELARRSSDRVAYRVCRSSQETKKRSETIDLILANSFADRQFLQALLLVSELERAWSQSITF